MKLKWTDEQIRSFSKPVIKAERTGGWVWWLLMATGLSVAVWACIQIWEYYQLNLWLDRI